jgi:hypothetical protein
LAEGFATPAPDEDGPTIMVVATPAAGEHGGTYKTPSKQDIPITVGPTLTPYRSGDTSARWGCSGGPVNDPISVQDHFSRHAPTEIPACGLKMSPSEGRSSGNGEWGGGVISPSSPFCHPLHHPLLRIRARSEFPPPVPLRPPDRRSSLVSFASVLVANDLRK